MCALLWADGVTVARGRTVLLERFSVRLEAGEIVHLRGANGSGKSSLMRLLAGVVEPRRGSVGRTGGCVYVPERIALPESLPALAASRGRGSTPPPESPWTLQSMIMAALDDALDGGALQRYFAADPESWAAHLYLSYERMSIR